MTLKSSHRFVALCAGLATAATLTAAVPAFAAPGAQSPFDRAAPTAQSDFAADPLPTVQVDGIVWTVSAGHGRGFAGGQFANARPAGAAPGTNQTPRANLLAFDLATGELDTRFNAHVNGAVRDVTVTDDGSTVLIAGDFTQVNGHIRVGFAALDAATGAPKAPHLQLNGPARAVATHGSVAYLGGAFSSVRGVERGGVAAVDLNTGTVLPFNAWVPDGAVHSMVTSPDGGTVIIGGQFASIGAQAAGGVARLEAATGRVLPLPIASTLRTGGERSGVYGLSADERGFYIGGWKWNVVQGFEGIAAADWSGNLRWIADCHGDTVDVWSSGAQVHAAGHPYSCATVGGTPETVPETYDGMVSLTNEARGVVQPTPRGRSYLNYAGHPAPRLTSHNPAIDAGAVLGQSTHAIDGDGDYMVVGGEFPAVQGRGQQGLVRFARRGVGPEQQGPEYNQLGLRATQVAPGRVQVLVTPTWDRDDSTLTYRLTRQGQVVDERDIASARWARADYAVIDDVTGSEVTYSLTVIDPADNSTVTQTTVRLGAHNAPSGYAAMVAQDGAHQLWSTGTGNSAAGNQMPGLTDQGVMQLQAGARRTAGMLGDAIGFNGTGAAMATTGERSQPRYDVTVETWVQGGPGTLPGRLIGFGPSATANNERNDRLLYLDNDGHVRFGTWVPLESRTLRSPGPITDGRWHHVLGTVDAVGTHRLYVDGREVDSGIFATGALPMAGSWRLGGDDMTLWPGLAAGARTNAQIDSPAVYHRALGQQEVTDHLSVGVTQSTAQRPTHYVAGAGQVWFTERLGGGLMGGTALPGMRSPDLLVGDWAGDGIDDIGHREGSTFYLHHRATGNVTTFAFGRPDDQAYVGDWDGDGTETVAVRRGNSFFVKNSHSGGEADEVLTFGRASDEVLVGDWDGDGSHTLGVRRGNVYYILNDFSGGIAEEQMTFGRVQDVALVGDWDGDGAHSIALRRDNWVYASDDFSGGIAPTEFVFGRAGDSVFIGDWSGTGVDGMILGRANAYYVADRLRSGVADRSFDFPTPPAGIGEILVGRWGANPAESFALFGRP